MENTLVKLAIIIIISLISTACKSFWVNQETKNVTEKKVWISPNFRSASNKENEYIIIIIDDYYYDKS